MLSYDQLQIAVAAAKQRLELIRKKYPELKAYLVLSSEQGQCDTDRSPLELLSEYPALIVDAEAKTVAKELLAGRKELDAQAARGLDRDEVSRQRTLIKQQLDHAVSQFQYNGQCRLELRFGELHYPQIWQLQTDELIDRNLTPQTRASIRIVLGTLSGFLRGQP